MSSLNPQLIPNLKRTSAYTIQDFQIVSWLIDHFEVKVTTPHILTEVSNLIGRRSEIQRALGVYINIVHEQFVNSSAIAANETFSEIWAG